MDASHDHRSEYFRDYPELDFRVAYTYSLQRPEEIVFAAQPYEFIVFDKEGFEPGEFLIYGKLDHELKMQVGFKRFSFDMTQDLHERIGKIYREIENEFLERYANRDRFGG